MREDPAKNINITASVSGNKVRYKIQGAQLCSSLSIVGAPSVQGLSTIFGYIEIGKLTPATSISVVSKKTPAFFGSKKTTLRLGLYCNGQLASSITSIKPATVKSLQGTNSIVAFINALKAGFKTSRSS